MSRPHNSNAVQHTLQENTVCALYEKQLLLLFMNLTDITYIFKGSVSSCPPWPSVELVCIDNLWNSASSSTGRNFLWLLVPSIIGDGCTSWFLIDPLSVLTVYHNMRYLESSKTTFPSWRFIFTYTHIGFETLHGGNTIWNGFAVTPWKDYL